MPFPLLLMVKRNSVANAAGSDHVGPNHIEQRAQGVTPSVHCLSWPVLGPRSQAGRFGRGGLIAQVAGDRRRVGAGQEFEQRDTPGVAQLRVQVASSGLPGGRVFRAR